MIDTIRQKIKDELSTATKPVLLCSFGKESVLLLWLLREQCPTMPVIFWHHDMISEQWEFAQRLVKKWDLTVFNWPPADRYLVSRGEGVSMINEYMLGGYRFPTISDFERSDRCVLDSNPKRKLEMTYGFDLTFIGTKATDSHYIVGSNPLPQDMQFGSTRLVAPLRDMTDAQVWDAITELGVPYDELRYPDSTDARDPSAKHFCTRCLEGPTICPKTGEKLEFEWDKTASLEAFRNRFGFQPAIRS